MHQTAKYNFRISCIDTEQDYIEVFGEEKTEGIFGVSLNPR
ncbi:hypothetical protein [uncultured Dokdonia sp.]|nr:hypothetical protein [uncultured Dokdonia sp.]